MFIIFHFIITPTVSQSKLVPETKVRTIINIYINIIIFFQLLLHVDFFSKIVSRLLLKVKKGGLCFFDTSADLCRGIVLCNFGINILPT